MSLIPTNIVMRNRKVILLNESVFKNLPMIEFILATTIIVGKTEIGPDTIQYDLLKEEGQIEHVIDTNNVSFHSTPTL